MTIPPIDTSYSYANHEVDAPSPLKVEEEQKYMFKGYC
jgi:hypothetical protein